MAMIKAEYGFDVRSRLSGIQTETLVICGTKDGFWPLEMFAETAYRMPHGRLIMSPRAGSPPCHYHGALPVGWGWARSVPTLPFHSVEDFGHPSVVMSIRSAICVGVVAVPYRPCGPSLAMKGGPVLRARSPGCRVASRRASARRPRS
jgi:hypothetical protein